MEAALQSNGLFVQLYYIIMYYKQWVAGWRLTAAWAFRLSRLEVAFLLQIDGVFSPV